MQGADFDRVARLYHPLEQLVFGGALQRVRCAFLDALPEEGEVLLLGDGDGRYLEAALVASKGPRFVSLDSSGKMLGMARSRLVPEQCERVEFVHASLADWLDSNGPSGLGRFDMVVTHFFLDCFLASEVRELVPRVASLLRPGGCWLVSEFCRPPGPWWWRAAGSGLVAAMYGFFRVATGLGVGTLPDHRRVFRGHGFAGAPERKQVAWRGLITTELWRPVR